MSGQSGIKKRGSSTYLGINIIARISIIETALSDMNKLTGACHSY